MKSILLLSGLLLLSAPALAAQPFAGAWHWAKGQESFDLDLTQDGAKLTGYHSAIGQNGLKADEVQAPNAPSISGTIKGDTATVTFRSGFPDSEGSGHATLKLRGKNLSWKITDAKGEHYLPAKAVLTESK
jgi:hypothetical protein